MRCLCHQIDPETGEYNVTCYLCNEKVSNSQWNDEGEAGHRRTCHLRSE